VEGWEMREGMVEDKLSWRRIIFQKLQAKTIHVSPKPLRSQNVQREVEACEKLRGLIKAYECLKLPSTQVDESAESDRECCWPNLEFSR